jgi:hypothetical protein
MTYDPLRRRTVLFGGRLEGNAAFGETWEWDGTAWERAAVDGPPPLGAHAMAYDAGRGRVVVFGGSDGTTHGDLWEWDGTTWRAVKASGGPPRLHTAMAYDTDRRRLLIFGGFGDEREGDTWAFDANGWTRLDAEGPPARAEHEGVYMPELGFVIFGGIGGQGMRTSDRSKLNDIWVFHGAWLSWPGDLVP